MIFATREMGEAVAKFNARAITLYTKARFTVSGEFETDSASFQVMEKPSAGA